MDVTRAQLNDFLTRAIRDAAAASVDVQSGFRVRGAEITEADNVRIDLDNGDIIIIDVEHLVPRTKANWGSFK